MELHHLTPSVNLFLREPLAVRCSDVTTGMFASNAIMYFIIVTTAATLHAHGQTNIATAQQAGEALRPLAGAGAYWLFTLGLIGTGILAPPVILIVLLLTGDPAVMGDAVNSRAVGLLGWITFLEMVVAAFGLFF